MATKRTAVATAEHAIHVARDPSPASPSVRREAEQQAEAAKRATAAIKAKRPVR